jgi:hypothetical protein
MLTRLSLTVVAVVAMGLIIERLTAGADRDSL